MSSIMMPQDVEMEVPEGALTTPVIVVHSLDKYDGSTISQKVDNCIATHSVVVIAKTWCPFCKDVEACLSKQVGVVVHVIYANAIQHGGKILSHLQTKDTHGTVPMVYINGAFVGGCDTIKALQHNGGLEPLLHGLIARPRSSGTETLETSKLLPPVRSEARMPLFWFPNTTNNNVVRTTGALVFPLAVLSCAFYEELWARYFAVALLVDFFLRFLAGSFISPLGMLATVITARFKPDFRPGPPKQFASFCGTFFSLMGTLFYFWDFEGHEFAGAAFMGMLAIASGMEAFLDFCLGCLFFGYGIRFGIIPDTVYRVYTQTRQEVADSWNYKFLAVPVTKPVLVDTNPDSPIALKYKIKSDEWTKDDFETVRNMQVSYFGMPLSLAGLAVAFKIAGSWSQRPLQEAREIVLPDLWFYVVSWLSVTTFGIFVALYICKLFLYPRKVAKEWACPLRSNGFGLITITLMLYAFLMYDRFDSTGVHEVARIFWWIGAALHALLTVAKMGEWVARSLELEHVYAQWMLLPVGLGVSALVAPAVGAFADDNANSVGNQYLARFFQSFAIFMWITLFVITFFKTVTTPNSDNRNRHGIWIWLASPCVLGMADYVICTAEGTLPTAQCANQFSSFYSLGIFFFLALTWATFPQHNFFGQDHYNAGYWTECFALDTLAACASLFYAITGFKVAETLSVIFIAIAAISNLVAFLHFCYGLVRRRGVFTPEAKWGPLSFMKLTHEAIRGNLPHIQQALDAIDLDDETKAGKETIGLFAAHFNRFVVLHEEHAKHEDEVIFKTFNGLFPEHAKKYNDDHAEDHVKIAQWCNDVNHVLDEFQNIASRKQALDKLKRDLPDYFEHLKEHLQGEEDNLNPIGRKHVPLAVMKEMSREVWKMTPADKWEVIVPYIINNLPRHMQRVRYLKVLTWSLPERAQQIGAIVYRNVDAVMWERIRTEIPEIIPRGAPNWKRYY